VTSIGLADTTGRKGTVKSYGSTVLRALGEMCDLLFVPTYTLVNGEPVDRLGMTEPHRLALVYRKRVNGFKRSSEMTETRNNEYAKTQLPHRDSSRDSPDP